jgi:hypothetical protein
MTFWEGFALASALWFFVCVFGIYRGYWVGRESHGWDWSNGYMAGYADAIKEHQSELDEEKHGLNV